MGRSTTGRVVLVNPIEKVKALLGMDERDEAATDEEN